MGQFGLKPTWLIGETHSATPLRSWRKCISLNASLNKCQYTLNTIVTSWLVCWAPMGAWTGTGAPCLLLSPRLVPETEVACFWSYSCPSQRWNNMIGSFRFEIRHWLFTLLALSKLWWTKRAYTSVVGVRRRRIACHRFIILVQVNDGIQSAFTKHGRQSPLATKLSVWLVDLESH